MDRKQLQLFTRQKSAAFTAFKQHVDDLVAKDPTLKRLDCLNPYKSLNPQFDLSVPYNVDLDRTWQNFLHIDLSMYPVAYQYNLGVRDALYHLFQTIKGTVALPKDVYPVYQQIAQATNTNYVEYATMPYFETLPNADTLLVTFPHPIHGIDICENQLTTLLTWLSKDANRLLIIDRVYDYTRDNVNIKHLLKTERVVVLHSLSKTFLQQFMMGIAIVPKRLEGFAPNNIENFRVAQTLMAKYFDFPYQQVQRFNYRWHRLGMNSFPRGNNRYLVSRKITAQKLLDEERTIGIPGEVFNIDNNHTILSCLHESVAADDMQVMERYHAIASVNFARGYDKYSGRYSKVNIKESTYPDKFFLLEKDNLHVGMNKAIRLSEKRRCYPVVLKTTVPNYMLNAWHEGRGQYIDRNNIRLDEVLDADLKPLQVEDVYADSIAQNPLQPWDKLTPRSFSVLPIAKACQAKCPFCFSHSSISEEQDQGNFLADMEKYSILASLRGASRMVVTGGGEPTMLKHEKLLRVLEIGKRRFNKITMITNGYNLGQAEPDEQLKILLDYQENGLTCLSISRHSMDPDANKAIMHLDTQSDAVAYTFNRSHKSFPNLTLRLVCVLQKGGVENEQSLVKYIEWASSIGISEICFKELYVAVSKESVYYDSQYNDWARTHQVQLTLVTNYLNALMRGGVVKNVEHLPWRSPIYNLTWKGKPMRIAAYTEPSVYWERSNNLCRSWNLMADGTCYANLETKDSVIHAP